MKHNQKGFSLVELIIVMAIMAVIAVVGLTSFSLVTGQNVKSCASDLQSYIAQTKVQAMSRADETLTLKETSDGIYVNLSVEGKDVQIGKSGIQVKYQKSDGTTVNISDAQAQTLTLSFDRSSGAFKPLEDNSYCTAISIHGAGRTYQITLIPSTGKYYLEMGTWDEEE